MDQITAELNTSNCKVPQLSYSVGSVASGEFDITTFKKSPLF